MEPGDEGANVRSFFARALGIRELTAVGASCFLVIFFAIPLAHMLRVSPIFHSVLGFALVLVIARIPITRRAALIMIGVCFTLYLVMQFLVLAHHHLEPSNDFRTMWETAKDYVENGLRVPDRPQTQRAIPFYYPVVSIFGTSQKVYLTSNVILHTLSYGMVVWIARRFFGWPSAAKTALVLLFGIEPLFANTFPSHDVFGVFSVTLFLFLLVELDLRLECNSRPRLAVLAAFIVSMSMLIAWADWQRGTGVFCSLALVFYGVSAFVRRPAQWKLRIALAALVCVAAAIQSAGLKRAGLAADMPARELTSPEMSMLVFGSDEGDGKFSDWYRNARMANALENDEVAALGRYAPLDSLRENPSRKFRRYLEREETFLKTGVDEAWYVNDIEDSQWLDQEQLRKAWRTAMRYTRPIWWAIALLVGIAVIFRRDLLFDIKAIPLILVAMFMAAMGMLGEAQSRYAMFFVFIWPIYAGSPYLVNPLPLGTLGPKRRIARGMARIAVSLVAVIAIPVILIGLTRFLSRPALVNLHDIDVMVGKTTGSTARAGAPPWWKSVRNHIVISDAPIGSEEWTMTLRAPGHAPTDNSTLHLVVYNELGMPFDPYSGPSAKFTPPIGDRVPGRSLRVVIDGAVHETIDLSSAMAPTAFAIPGLAAGDHEIKLELDLGSKHRNTLASKCTHRWTPPDPLGLRPTSRCFNTSIGYLGFY